jgi:hypothetical protein
VSNVRENGHMTPEQKRIGELENALKEQERRIKYLMDERDRQAKLITDLRERIEEGSLGHQRVLVFAVIVAILLVVVGFAVYPYLR